MPCCAGKNRRAARYVVWQQDRLNDEPMTDFEARRAFASLFDGSGRTKNVFAIKFSYWINPYRVPRWTRFRAGSGAERRARNPRTLNLDPYLTLPVAGSGYWFRKRSNSASASSFA